MRNNKITFPYKKGVNPTDARNSKLLPERKHPPGTKPILVVDGMNIAYQAYYAYKKLSYKGKSVAILYGFPSILKSIMQIYNPEKVIVCWDGIKHEERMRLLPEYKSHRAANMPVKEKERFVKQVEKTRKLLYRLGIVQAHNPEVEGDDLIYMVTKRMQIYAPIIIVSGDSDFKQLINHDVRLYNPRNKFIETVFAYPASNYGLEIAQYVDFKSLVGDESDDIPGINGIGPKRASDFLLKYWSIQNYLDSDQDYTGLIDKERLAKIARRNRRLIDLELFHRKYNKHAKVIYYRDKSNGKYHEMKFLEICGKYNFKSLRTPLFLKPFQELAKHA